MDHYEILGISDDEADEARIKKAFRKLAPKLHPDQNPGKSGYDFDRAKQARDFLLDPKRRKAYNQLRRDRMKDRGEGVSKGGVQKEKDKRAAPGTFFKSGGATGSTQSEFKKFTQDAKDNKQTPNFKEYARRSKFNFSFGEGSKDKKETPNFEGNAQSNASQPSSGPGAQGAKDNKETPNFEEYVRRSKFNFSFGQGTKDNKETPNFAEHIKRKKFNFSSPPDNKSNEETSNFAEYAKRSKFNFSFGNPNTENKKETPNFSGDAQANSKPFFFGQDNEKKDSSNFAGGAQKEGGKFAFGAEPMDTNEDLPHKKPFRGGAATSGGTGADEFTHGVDDTTNEASVIEFFVTLENVARGCMQDMSAWRRTKLEDGTIGNEKLSFSFEVKKGWKAGTKVTFGKAVQQWKNPTRDIVFVMRDAPHPIFTRDGSDLLYTASVSAVQVELGSSIAIPTLDGGQRLLDITPNFIDNPDLLKRIKGEGLPFPKEPTKKGDLIVKFVSSS